MDPLVLALEMAAPIELTQGQVPPAAEPCPHCDAGHGQPCAPDCPGIQEAVS